MNITQHGHSIYIKDRDPMIKTIIPSTSLTSSRGKLQCNIMNNELQKEEIEIDDLDGTITT